MKLTGENSAKLMITRKSLNSELFEVVFSCEWCSGKFEMFLNTENYQNLEKVISNVCNGKSKERWISEEGDLEIELSRRSNGVVQTHIVCTPSVKLVYPGSIDFFVDFDLISLQEYTIK